MLEGGQVYVDAAGVIQCAACDCSAMATGATTINCPQGVVSPGLINAHDHITYTKSPPFTNTGERYESRHDWRRGLRGHTEIPSTSDNATERVQWGELRFVMGGATAALSEGSTAGLMRNLDASSALEGLTGGAVQTETFPLDDLNPIYRNSDCNYGAAPDTASSINATAYAGHVSEGVDATSRNEFLCLSNTFYDTATPGVAADLVLQQTSFVHAMPFTGADYAQMARDGASVIWSPRSNICLYGDTAMVTAAAKVGANIMLGTDWTITGSINVLRELACADELNRNNYGGAFTDADLWRMATLNVATGINRANQIGTLEPGRQGDISIFNGATNTHHRAVIAAQPQDVVLVMRSGNALYGDDAVVNALRANCDTLDVCTVTKRACVTPEFNTSLSALQAANASSYPAFFCGVPTNEPTCVPSRAVPVNGSSVYTGVPEPTMDPDGDGIQSAMDNCPTVFNPIRPVDDRRQSDVDDDGVGDACDPCPINANTTTCMGATVTDFDADGFDNGVDNCPVTSNPSQSDVDTDGKGDRCDACPAANPGNTPCPSTIHDIKRQVIPLGTVVRVNNTLVTARNAQGFFLQMTAGDQGFVDENFSGIFVFNSTNTVVVGSRVSVTATSQDFNGQTQLAGTVTVTVDNATPAALPAPVVATLAEVDTGGTRANALEGVLVTVGGPHTVTAVDTMFNEFTLGTVLTVDDYLFLVSPLPAINDVVQSATGVLAFRNNNSKLLPRNTSDVVFGPPSLDAFGPPGNFIRVGDVASPTVPVAAFVALNRPAEVDTFVAVASGDINIAAVSGGGTTVPAGQTTAVVLLDAFAPGTVTLTATLDAVNIPLSITVLDPAQQPVLVALEPAVATVLVGGTLSLGVTLDIPAPTGGTVINLAINPSTAGTIPATVTVPAGQLSQTFDYVDGSTEASVTVSATLDAVTLNSDLTLVATLRHLTLNEVDYNQAATDANSFIEIYNPTSAPIALADYAVVLINGNGNTEYARFPLSGAGATIPADGYVVIRNATVVLPNGTPFINATGDWIQNGPDGLALINTATNTLVDALCYGGDTFTAVTITGFPGPVSLVEGTAITVIDSTGDLHSLARLPNGTDADNAITDWALTTSKTPGAPNQ